MAPIDCLKHIQFSALTNQNRREVKKSLQEHKRTLRSAIKQIDQGLAALGSKRKTKRAAKRKTARR